MESIDALTLIVVFLLAHGVKTRPLLTGCGVQMTLGVLFLFACNSLFCQCLLIGQPFWFCMSFTPNESYCLIHFFFC